MWQSRYVPSGTVMAVSPGAVWAGSQESIRTLLEICMWEHCLPLSIDSTVAHGFAKDSIP